MDPEFAHLVSGVERGLFHGSGIIIGYTGGVYVALETDAPDGVYVIMTTSIAGLVVDNTKPVPEVHEAGDEGSFPVMEVDYDTGNIVIATGDAPFGQYMGLYKPEMLRADRYGEDTNPQQGGRLFENIIDYVTQYSGLLIDSVNVIEAKTGEISSLESEVSGLEGEVSDLEDDVDDLEEEVSDLEDDVGDLEDGVTDLEGEVTALETSIDSLTEELATTDLLISKSDCVKTQTQGRHNTQHLHTNPSSSTLPTTHLSPFHTITEATNPPAPNIFKALLIL